MKKWKFKALIQKSISKLPYCNEINFLFQKYVTGGVYLRDDFFKDRLGHCSEHLKAYASSGKKSIPEVCLELGTGWHPVVPIGFFLSGCSRIYSVDISQLMNTERVGETISKYLEWVDSGRLNSLLDVVPERLYVLRRLNQDGNPEKLEELLSDLNITYLVEDATSLSLPDNSVDLVTSNNTFEHIPKPVLEILLREFKRVVKKLDGVMSHFIDMSDHYAHFDKSITVYNYLQYNEKQWRKFNNHLHWQNRLRIDDYRKTFDRAGVPVSKEVSRPGNIEELRTVALDEIYASKPESDIAVTHSNFISDMSESK